MKALPAAPMGDIDLGDPGYSSATRHMGQTVDLGDVSVDLGGGAGPGAPSSAMALSGATDASTLASHIASLHPSVGAHVLATIAPTMHKAVAQGVRAEASVKALAKNHSVPFERVSGGRIVSSTLGPPPVMLHSTSVTDLKRAVHESVPFAPTVFPFAVVGPGAFAFDFPTALNTVIPGSPYPLYIAGVLITLQASVFNTQIGAWMNVTRNLGTLGPSTTSSVVDLIELESGAKVVQLLLLNGILVAGKARFWAPPVVASAVPDPTTAITLSNVPPNYLPNLRMLQPGDQQVEHLLNTL